jgi:hypothetical protein
VLKEVRVYKEKGGRKCKDQEGDEEKGREIDGTVGNTEQ